MLTPTFTAVSLFLLPVWDLIVSYFGYLWAFMGEYTVYVIVFFVMFALMYFFKFVVHLLRMK